MDKPSLQDGLREHQAGNLAKAQRIYLSVLKDSPGEPYAMHYLGLCAHQQGRSDEASDWMQRSIMANPNVPDFHCNLGVLLRNLGKLDEAAASLCTAIQLRPMYPEALNNLGDVLRMRGRLSDAETVLRQSIALRSTLSALNNLGLVLIDAKRADEAIDVLREAMQMSPTDRATARNLGIALRATSQHDEAILLSCGMIQSNDQDADTWFGLGNSLRATAQLADAADAYRRALALRPDHAELLIDLCGTLADLGELSDAINVGSRAIVIEPHSHNARYNLAIAMLKSGRLLRGWEFYESRWNCQGYVGSLSPIDAPQWDGRDPTGRTLLIRAEQGAGDTIQFCRYLPLLSQRGAKIVLECQKELKTLLSRISGVHHVVARGEDPGRIDWQLPLLSLPHVFQTTLETIPAAMPYLHADPQRITAWNARFLRSDDLRCGLVWAGNPGHYNDKSRSISLSELAPLSRVRGVQFFSLQKGKTPDDSFPGLIDLSESLTDYAETAAVITNVDFVISVDTSVAHLAGALRKPVWTLIPRHSDWRWLTETAATPWYPTMRLFRQQSSGIWSDVIEKLTAELTDHVAKRQAA